ncbi:hypothetical protein PMAYCL1PPCAC_03305, partial [Pristionchus mayeri]
MEKFAVECVEKVCDKRNISFDASKVDIRPNHNESLALQSVCKDTNETLYVNGAVHDSLQC